VIFCTRCGSRNHLARDCSKPDQKLSPPPEPKADRKAWEVDGGAVEQTAERGSDESPPPPAARRFRSAAGLPRLEFCGGEQEVELEAPKLEDGRKLWAQRVKARALVCFDSPADAKAFVQRRCPGSHVARLWNCGHCGGWHFWPSPSGPGEAAGDPRVSRYPRAGFRPYVRESTLAAARAARAAELPASEENERKAKDAAAKAAAAPAKRKPRADKDGNLDMFRK